ncbi:MAG TPA: hypothetical protein VJ689_01250 [Gaiellaceae bacterium]|nr:hypothetical protein [Gaiellaceae bacterium]
MGEPKSAVGSGLWAIVHEDCELCELFVTVEQAEHELARVQEWVPELAEKLSIHPIPVSLELSAN